MKVIAIVQARMGSTRLPNKMLKKIGKKSLIQIVMSRLSMSKKIDKIILATSIAKNNDTLVSHVKKLGYDCYRGSENNVLERFFLAAKKYDAEVIVRITGDCPLVDHDLVDMVINNFLNNKVDYSSNINPSSYPDGLDVEVFSFKALKGAYEKANKEFDLEHVTPFIYNSNIFKTTNIEHSEDLSTLRWTVDEQADLDVIIKIYEYFNYNSNISWRDVAGLCIIKPEIFLRNSNIQRNEGSLMSKGQKLYKRAKEIIPGGTMLLSKRPEMFLPETWPSYFSKSKGCNVWDLDNKKYIDMSLMGVGTNILGYGHEEIDKAVIDTVKKGNMSTLNCPEEVYLAEKLIEMHDWADMARFARSGGEANAIAIRIARAACGKNNVAVCGYHGWHDWYMAANLSDPKNLSGLLMPGLEPAGVNTLLKDTVFPFYYNDFDGLKTLVETKNIGVIKMEVFRSEEPTNNFLAKVRQLADKNNIVLIFDECTSGFRENFGGLHKKYGVNPDMAMFGKAMGNGYGITATIGKKEVMEAAQKSFISSTFWTERIGPSAALKTLEIMKKTESWNIITEQGLKIRDGWQRIAKNNNVKIAITGLPALSSFAFESSNHLIFKTYITQEMLKKGYLASNSIYVCIEHTDKVIDAYLDNLDPILKIIGDCEDKNDISNLLEGPVSHSGFSRLN
jgi:glutamate-1-semialdehyde 2,1-aminomutase